MATDPMLLDDEDYASDQDSDFAPDDGALGGNNHDDGDDDADNTGDDSDSDSEDDGGDADRGGYDESLQNTAAAAAAAAGIAGTSSSSTRKRESAPADGDDDDDDDDDHEGAEGDGFENSGDEAVIQKGQKKLKRKQAKKKHGAVGRDEDDEDEGGEGGLIRTRAMRAAEKSERRDRGVVPSGPVTIDVDDMWAWMMSGAEVLPGSKADGDHVEGVGKTDGASAEAGGDKKNQQPDGDAEKGTADKKKSADGSNGNAPAMIKIKRTYNFAGKVHTEEKLVARDSAEAKLYIASLDPKSAEYIALTSGSADKTLAGNNDDDDEDESSQLRRPRKAFRSIFEPVLLDATGQQQQRRRADLNLGLSAALQQREAAFRLNGGKAKKLNVVEKSRMDWAGFVDKEGIKDDLELAGRSKESYAHRQDFLSRVEMNREEEARRARLAGRT